MFCYQCQETAKGTGCTKVGVCGKSNEVANFQDLLLYTLKGLSIYSTEARKNEIDIKGIDTFIIESLFSTITNANFNKDVIIGKIKLSLELRDKLKNELSKNNINIDEKIHSSLIWNPKSVEEYEIKAMDVGILSTENEDIRSLRELLTYGIKGIAAYAKHAENLGYQDNEIHEFIQKGLAATTDDTLSADDLVQLVMECGKNAVTVMALLDEANTKTYGNPEITNVNIGVRNNPGILISGHDLKDMEQLLKQTEGTGIDVYTHSEMLPANYYPEFKKYDHFVGNYGNAWWKQKEEFEKFNGPILLTTNCLVPPKETYMDRVYTTGEAGFPGVKHIDKNKENDEKDFSEIIEHAKKCDAPIEIEKGQIVGGFAHNTVISLADKVIEAVKENKIKQFFVMAGCDGRMKNRDYYSQFASELPEDTVILTAGCAKYRYNKLELGDINGIPRVLDAGQCNDSYSLAVIALKLKEAFGLEDINELPISYNIAWYEQKAVTVLLALLYLGVKKIKLGPTLPAFLSPNVAKILVETFGISAIDNVSDDMHEFLEDKLETASSN